ncbi:DUF4431 domain-containing protein [Gallibacterium anatis]|uniref:DUF4431 domain-containing protein n=1 Tax=Gallibacterium anatis TaxID=750 RepID=A0A377H4P2_9PAST|nr:DUF4431 domain-containing protein [Gallibacterium anatis]KGQ41231.1 hypothetical protein JP35_01310 [Gallibacterium anatis]KGQ54509.1 hypothetical protein IE01_09800 [Gallibacterium anatis DSM 16844 = F 149]KGQ63148.1 hypothetical protein IO43_08050 [Gallibacterium anatis 7990]OBW90622.1 hypothetical protein QV02_11895 [Gallibacterium anatis]STO37439.1 Uncharacterised protein [Gallibacterium anatis]
MKKVLFTMLGISLLGLSYTAQAKTYVYDKDDVALQGIIKIEKNYPYLYLKQGIDVVPAPNDDLYNPARNVKRMQVVNVNAGPGDKTPTGCQIVKGSLFGAHTAHHKTPVLVWAKSFEKCK